MKILNSTELNFNVNNLGIMANQHFKFLQHTFAHARRPSINKENLVKAHIHIEEGRGGYFAPESGTSEGQFILARGMIDMYKVTKDTKWLDMAENLMQATFKYLFKGKSIPTEVSLDNLWTPHWLFNAHTAFISQKYYLYHKLNFTNGVGYLSSEYALKQVYSVRALDATLNWESPTANVIGKEYIISQCDITDKTAVITLEENFTGEAFVVYSDFGGEIIQPNELYEAYPIWRKLDADESCCAIDSLWWLYDCFKSLSEITGKEIYVTATEYLKAMTIEVVKLPTIEEWHTLSYDPNSALSGGLYQWQNKTPEATLVRDVDGSVLITIPEGPGEVQYGRGSVNFTVQDNHKIMAKLASSIDTTVTFFMSPDDDLSYEGRYFCKIKLDGNDVAKEYELTPKDFIRTSNLLWDIEYIGDSVEESYTSPNSKATFTDISDIDGRRWRKVTFNIGKETNEEGYPYDGWCQYSAIIGAHRFDFNSIPPYHLKATGNIVMKLKDANGHYWETPVTVGDDFITFQPEVSSFRLAAYQENPEPAEQLTFPYQTIIFDALQDKSTLEIKYIGELLSIPAQTLIRDFVLNITDEREHKVKIFYTRVYPTKDFKYAPYVAPFTINVKNNKAEDWRGTPYTGYQCPWFWQEVKQPEGVETVLQFLLDAQDEYKQRTNVDGFFMPVFIWDRWDNVDYGKPNTFTWDGPDPNTFWGGFQYRTIETVARTFFMDNTNERAKRICLRFFNAVDDIWTRTGSYPVEFREGQEPSTEYKDIHNVALLLRATTYYYQATDNSAEEETCKRLMRKCLNELKEVFKPFNNNVQWNGDFVNGTWSWHANQWNMFWGGEMLSAFALLMSCCQNEFFIKTSGNIKRIITHPEVCNISPCVMVKTPIGIHKMELVDIDDLKASPIRIKTELKEMAVKLQ